MKFSEQRIKDWRRYEKVRKRGHPPLTIKATGLDVEAYYFVMNHYSALKKQVTGI